LREYRARPSSGKPRRCNPEATDGNASAPLASTFGKISGRDSERSSLKYTENLELNPLRLNSAKPEMLQAIEHRIEVSIGERLQLVVNGVSS
jgi:hypothetical protein